MKNSTIHLYIIVNLINNKKYIGQTSKTIEERWKSHCRNKNRGSNLPLHSAMRKYGQENFKVKGLARCNTFQEANHREAYYIKLFNTRTTEKGYNIRLGGMNAPLSEEHKIKIGNANRNKKKPPMSDAQKRSISESLKNKPKSKQHKIKLALANLGNPHTEERKKNLSKAWKTRKNKDAFLKQWRENGIKNSKRIICNENGIIYSSINEACRQLNLFKSNVTRVLNGKQKHVKGFTFKWAH